MTAGRRSRPGIWTEELNSAGPDSSPGSSPPQIFFNNTAAYPWETTVEDPSMRRRRRPVLPAVQRGHLHLVELRRGLGRLRHADQPLRPDRSQPDPVVVRLGRRTRWGFVVPGRRPATTGSTTAVGPPGCTNYSCGGARRLFVTPITFVRRHSGSTSRRSESPTTADAGLLAGRPPTAASSPSASRFYGSTGGHPPQRADGRAWPPPPTAGATGWWPPTAASSPSATPGSTARPGAIHLNQPIVGMAPTPDGDGLLAGGLRRRHLHLR